MTAPYSRVIRTGRATLASTQRTFGAPCGRRVLDVGAGDSPLAAELHTAGCFAVALDPQYASTPGPADLAVAATCSRLPFRDAVFDEVYASWVLLHVDNRVAALREIGRVVTPGGRVCIQPVWHHRAAFNRLSEVPQVEVIRASLRPRRRAALVVRIDETFPHLIPLLLAVTSPRLVLSAAGGLAMSVLIRVRGRTEVDTARWGSRRR